LYAVSVTKKDQMQAAAKW